VLPELLTLAALSTSMTTPPATDAQACAQRPATDARVVLARMTEPQRVGQLFMVGAPATGPTQETATAVTREHVGNVMLTGRSRAGVRATAGLVARLQARASSAATSGVRLLVSTDQEGGDVQVLRGPGVSTMPSALGQRRYSPARLRAAAGRWARQLREAGVNMDLAPVLDSVPGPRAARHNPPVGAVDREYGFTPRVVAGHGTAFAAALERNRVLPTAKHFPGLGRVHANTDTAAGVTDRVTGPHDPFLRPFRAAISRDHVPFVMMSTAYYPRLDPRHPAAFSPFVIGRLLRGELGFSGVVVSDDLGSARQVAAWPPGRRAVQFLRAGGDLVLTVTPATARPMYDAVLSLARHRSQFRRRVDAATLRILRIKQRYGLLGRQPPVADVPLLPPASLPSWLRVPGAAPAGGCEPLS
jgi:beta-N-acetylhexosaminidase